MQLENHGAIASDRLVSAQRESRCVLFATQAAQPSLQSVRRAEALADSLGVSLHVLRVLPQLNRGSLMQHIQVDDSAHMLEQFIGAARESASWCREVLRRFVDEQLAVHVGGFSEQVTASAQQLRAALIVVAAGEFTGVQVTELVRATGLPVFVAPRSSAGSSTIVAATNLRSKDTPVLRLARALGRLRDAPVVAVHGVPGATSVKQLWARLNPERLVQSQHALVASQRELAQVSAALGVAGAVIVQAPDHVAAIMNEVRALEADIVVVGTHAGWHLGRLLRKSVAAQIVDQAQGSVLVEPLQANRE